METTTLFSASTILVIALAVLALALAFSALRLTAIAARVHRKNEHIRESEPSFVSSVDAAVALAYRIDGVRMTPQGIALIKVLLKEAVRAPPPTWPSGAPERLLAYADDPRSLAELMARAAHDEGASERGEPLGAFDVIHWITRNAFELLGGPVEKDADRVK